MISLPIPADKVADVQSRACETWVLEHCRRGVQGYVEEGGGFALRFEDDAEAEAFRRRWLL